MLTAALVRQLDKYGAQTAMLSLSLYIQLGRKNKHRLTLLFATQNNLVDSYVSSSIRHQARQSPLMFISCLDAHVTPSHEDGDRDPSNPSPPASADTRDGAALARGAVLWVHARTQAKTKKQKRVSPANIRRRQCPSRSSEMPRMYLPSTLGKKTKLS